MRLVFVDGEVNGEGAVQTWLSARDVILVILHMNVPQHASAGFQKNSEEKKQPRNFNLKGRDRPRGVASNCI